MSEQDLNSEAGEEPVAIPINDKRRFNERGERISHGGAAVGEQPAKSAIEIELEDKLRKEIDRREAAESKLVGVQTKFDEARSELERDTAEMRARLMKTLEDRAKQGQFNFLITLLPVLDNLNLAIAASEKDPSVDHLRDGVKGTARSFEQALLSVGVQPVPAVGVAFDPELHEAVDVVTVEPENDGIVTAEYSSGYKFGDRLLRPARVQVGKSMEAAVDK